jgi:hypothetical protein
MVVKSKIVTDLRATVSAKCRILDVTVSGAVGGAVGGTVGGAVGGTVGVQ